MYNGSKLCKRFDDLVIQKLCHLHGETAKEKLVSWYHDVFSVSDNACPPSAADDCIASLYESAKEWLINNSSSIGLSIASLEVGFDKSKKEFLVGNSQLGFLHCNLTTRSSTAKRNTTSISPNYINLFYYAKWEAIEAIIKSGVLRVSIPAKCNDLYEYMPAWSNEGERCIIEETYRGMEQVFVCLSRNPFSPMMWGIYGDHGRGAALIFKFPVYHIIAGENTDEGVLAIAQNESMIKNLERCIIINDVSYANKRPFAFAPCKNYYDYTRLYSTKDITWQFEEEERIIFNKGESEHNVYKLEDHYYTRALTPYISGIILGPKCPYTSKTAPARIRQLVRDGGNKINQLIRIHAASYHQSLYKVDVPAPVSVAPPTREIPIYWRIEAMYSILEQ